MTQCLRRFAGALALCLFWATAAVAGQPVHALTISGAPGLPADFAHLPHVRPDAPKGGTLRMGSIGTFDSFHPFIMRGMPAAQISLTYETLGESNRNEDFAIYGLLANSFELAPDRTWLICRLHPEARFSDGKPVTADDVAFTFRALVEHGSPFYRDYYAQVAGVDVLDAHTVRFRFATRDNPELPVIVAQLPVLPAHWWQGRDFSAPQREAAPGSGPYRVREHRPGASITYERVPGWWGERLSINRGRYNFDAVRCDYYRDVTVARQAFLGGEFDLWSESTIKDWAESYDVPAVRDGRIVREEIPHGRTEGMSGFIFNTRQPRFADARVRRAVAMAFDFEWTNKALFHGAYLRCPSYFTNSEFAAPPLPGEGELALLEPLRDKLDPAVFGEISRPTAGDGSGDIRPRLREALALLREAGWDLRDGALRNARGEQLRFTLLLSSKGLERVVLPYRRNLERMGIAMDVQVADQTQYVARIRAFDFDMMYATLRQSNSPGNEQRSFWTSAAAERPGSRNYAGIRDAAVDALVERIVAAPDRTTLTDAVRALDRVLLHGAYVVPGWYSDKLRVAHWKTRVAHPATPPRGGMDVHTWWATDANPAPDEGTAPHTEAAR